MERGSRGMLVLDTHVLIWAHMGIRIPKKVERRIAAAGKDNQLFISAITPWEIALGVRGSGSRLLVMSSSGSGMRSMRCRSRWHHSSPRSPATRSIWPGNTRIPRIASSSRPHGGSVLRW